MQLVRLGPTLAAGLLAAGAALAQPVPQHGGKLRLLAEPEPKALVMLADPSTSAGALAVKVTEGLLNYAEDGRPLPQLALRWEISADQLRYSFWLRPGVRWHDGRPFGAEDVRYSILQARERLSRARISLAAVERMEVPEPLRLVIHLRRPVPYLLQVFAANETPIVPRHLYEGTDIATNPHNLAPVGTGPFRFKEWVRGSHIVFERNPDYWRPGRPYLDRIVVRFIPEPASRIIAFESDAVDMEAHSTIPLYAIRKLQADPRLRALRVDVVSSAGVRRIEFNLRHPQLRKLAVRQAIAHAVDKQQMRRSVFSGLADVSPSPIVPGQPFHLAVDDPYPYDPARAEQLLDAAGLPRGPGGVRLRLALDFIPEGSGEPRRVAEFVKASLRRVGIQVSVRGADVASYMRRIYTTRDFDMVSNGLGNSFDPSMGTQRAYWSRSHVPGVPFSNASGYANPEVDALLEAGAAEPDPARRAALFDRFQQIVVHEIPVLNFVGNWAFVVHNRRVQVGPLGRERGAESFADVHLAPDSSFSTNESNQHDKHH